MLISFVAYGSLMILSFDSEIIDVAQNVLLRAHELRDDGQLHYAIPLYYDVSCCFTTLIRIFIMWRF